MHSAVCKPSFIRYYSGHGLSVDSVPYMVPIEPALSSADYLDSLKADSNLSHDPTAVGRVQPLLDYRHSKLAEKLRSVCDVSTNVFSCSHTNLHAIFVLDCCRDHPLESSLPKKSDAARWRFHESAAVMFGCMLGGTDIRRCASRVWSTA